MDVPQLTTLTFWGWLARHMGCAAHSGRAAEPLGAQWEGCGAPARIQPDLPNLRPWTPRREMVGRVALHMEHGAALRTHHGGELRTHLKRRTEARRERLETEQAALHLHCYAGTVCSHCARAVHVACTPYRYR